MKYKILIVDDEKNMIWALTNALKKADYQIESTLRGDKAISKIEIFDPDLILLDIKLPGMDGISVLKSLRKSGNRTPVIMMTAHGTLDTAIQALKFGATDYLSKPFDLEEMKVTVEKALEFGQMTKEIHYLKDELKKGLKETVIGDSQKMKDLLQVADQVAQSDATILITGESGTGKEVIADYIYKSSARLDQAFVKVNCGALTETLLESELFGHEKGAFTGAVSRKPGRFERADGGTIFLDEIGEIPLSTQVKLLRILQQKEFERVGGTETLTCDVRILAATNRNLARMVENGTFREDLYYRLNVIPIEIPPLRDRKEDIPLLFHHFLEKYSKKMKKGPIQVDEEAMECLINYSWKGNIRELENLVERMVILSRNQKIGYDDLPLELKARENDGRTFDLPDEGIDLEQVEKDLIGQALEKTGQNQTRAAKLLGISRHTLLYRMEKYNMK
tara:strand:- start:21 stop:1370 length:1350 start_codon:yes stop_codon:yes gene_type:complete